MNFELNKPLLLFSREHYKCLILGFKASILGLAIITFILGNSSLRGEVPKEVIELQSSYQDELIRVKAPIDKVLRNEASKIMASLVKQGQTEEARHVGEQVEQKLSGKTISKLQPELHELLNKYDVAVANATGPLRERYSRRVDDLIQKHSGKDMAAILALGEVKKRIEEKETISPATNSPNPSNSLTKLPHQSELKDGKLDLAGQTWVGPFGKFEFEKQGTGFKTGTGGNRFKFSWKVLSNNQIDYVEMHPNGGYMNRRIWTFDESFLSAEIVDPLVSSAPYKANRTDKAKVN